MGVDEVNLGRGDGRTAGVRGARHGAWARWLAARVVFGVLPTAAGISVSPSRAYNDKIVIARADGYLAQLRPGRTAGIEPQSLLRRAGLDRVSAGAISISSRARHTFLVTNYVASPI